MYPVGHARQEERASESSNSVPQHLGPTSDPFQFDTKHEFIVLVNRNTFAIRQQRSLGNRSQSLHPSAAWAYAGTRSQCPIHPSMIEHALYGYYGY